MTGRSLVPITAAPDTRRYNDSGCSFANYWVTVPHRSHDPGSEALSPESLIDCALVLLKKNYSKNIKNFRNIVSSPIPSRY